MMNRQQRRQAEREAAKQGKRLPTEAEARIFAAQQKQEQLVSRHKLLEHTLEWFDRIPEEDEAHYAADEAGLRADLDTTTCAIVDTFLELLEAVDVAQAEAEAKLETLTPALHEGERLEVNLDTPIRTEGGAGA